MNVIQQKVQSSPIVARVLPFAVFVILTSLQGQLGEASRYWIYVAKTFVGAWLLWIVWPHVREMRWKFSWQAVGVGLVVFFLWIGLDGFYPKAKLSGSLWNPHDYLGENSALAWSVILVRFIAVTVVVPPLEEIFYRSFLYRYLINTNFLSVPLGRLSWISLVITAGVFGLAHHEWLPGILCGLAYQGLAIRNNRLGDAMMAHAVTNLLLGVWVVWRGAWQYW